MNAAKVHSLSQLYARQNEYVRKRWLHCKAYFTIADYLNPVEVAILLDSTELNKYEVHAPATVTVHFTPSSKWNAIFKKVRCTARGFPAPTMVLFVSKIGNSNSTMFNSTFTERDNVTLVKQVKENALPSHKTERADIGYSIYTGNYLHSKLIRARTNKFDHSSQSARL